MATSNNNEATAASTRAAAIAEDEDAKMARRLHAIEQLTNVFGFDAAVASQAVDAVGPDDVTACWNYILDAGLAQDGGGPVTPIENCPHLDKHLKLTQTQLPAQVHHTVCTFTGKEEETTSSNTGKLKEDVEENTGKCPAAENWLCLECGAVRCSRYINGHGLSHWKATKESDPEGVGHCVAVSLADLSVWCHGCSAYLHHKSLQPILQTLEKRKFAKQAPPHAAGPQRKKAKGIDDEPVSNDMGNTKADDDDDDDDESGEDGDDADPIEAALESGNITIEDLIAVASARGIPIMLGDDNNDDENEGPLEYPFGSELPKDTKGVAEFILSEKCRSVLILAGAGMSVASGIPDFRSANGLYSTLQPELLTASPGQRHAIASDPTLALEQPFFLQNPLPCLELKRDFILKTHQQEWKATLAHRFVELLHAKTGKLRRLYTQNIDGLEDQCTQLPRDKVICVHGSMDRAECAACGVEQTDMDAFCRAVKTQIKDISGRDPAAPAESTPIVCSSCGAPAVKPSIVLFKASLPKAFFERVPEDVKGIDLLIVVGTSLRVAPANSLVWRVPKTAMRLLINREEVGWHLGMNFDSDEEEEAKEEGVTTEGEKEEKLKRRDYFAQGSCDEVVLDLMEHLGWLPDLKPLLEKGLLPEESTNLLRQRLAQTNSTLSA